MPTLETVSNSEPSTTSPALPKNGVPIPVSQENKRKLSAAVQFKNKPCTLTFDAASDVLTMHFINSRGKVKYLLNISTYVLLNVESQEERAARQAARQCTDEDVRRFYIGAKDNRHLCAIPHSAFGSNDKSSVGVNHSRNMTGVSDISTPALNRSTSLGDVHALASSGQHQGQPRTLYYIHYVKNTNADKSRIQTVEFSSSNDDAPAREQLDDVITAVLLRVYTKGPKSVVLFISPRSGSGKGHQVFLKHIEPILHFSRHTTRTYITSRAHDCEDCVADLGNTFDQRHVITAVGGDGMIHEVVNGLHRRKLAVIHRLRELTAQSSVSLLRKKSRVASNDVNYSSTKDTDENDIRKNHSSSSSEFLSTEGTEVNSPEMLAQLLHERAKSPGDAAALHARSQSDHDGVLYGDIDWRFPEYGDYARPHTMSESWDAVSPLIATIPTGSACGLAKSMDVLTPTTAALALIHLSTCHLDLIRMNFKPNADFLQYHRAGFSERKRKLVAKSFSEYQHRYEGELSRRAAHPSRDDPPFLSDGTPVYTDAVSLFLGSPCLSERVAFMSLSFGVANDIDRGSEHLRWMGNARFSVYGGYVIIRGLSTYKGVLRYLPWESRSGLRVEKLHRKDKMPHPSQIPPCTMRDDCPHCRQYPPPQLLRQPQQPSSVGADNTSAPLSSLADYSDSELLNEDDVDFDDGSLPWKTIEGEFYNVILCNIRDVAQDMIMAPAAHISDGSIDIVFSRIDDETGGGGRKEFVQFFTSLETGTHVDYPFTNYVKARAVEVKIDGGISMSDGEMMPLSSVRLTKLRHAVRVVRQA